MGTTNGAVTRSKQPSLTGAEQSLLLTELWTRQKRVAVAVQLMLQLGLRLNEARSAQWGWIQNLPTDAATFTVPAATAKGGVARTLPIPTPLRIMLRHLLAKQHLEAPVSVPQTWPLVLNRWGGAPSARYIQRVLAFSAASAIGRSIRTHTLRHTFATALAKVAPLRVVQVALGHRSVKTTQLYLEVTLDDLSRHLEEKARTDLIVTP